MTINRATRRLPAIAAVAVVLAAVAACSTVATTARVAGGVAASSANATVATGQAVVAVAGATRDIAVAAQARAAAQDEALAAQSAANASYELGLAEGAIRAVLSAQQAAWNRGDIDGFMAGYWQSPELTFISGTTVTRGWQETRDRYRSRYDSREKMGTLSFEIVDIRAGKGQGAAPDFAVVLGRWALARETSGNTGGWFTLLFERRDGSWLIVRDHTS